MLPRFTSLLLFAFIISCKKDAEDKELPLLAKMETILAGEAVITTIEYTDDKLIYMQALGSSGGRSVNITTRFIRNSKGIIEKIIIKNPSYLTTFSVDSIMYAVNYSTASDRYTSLVNYLYFKTGTTEYDSTFFTYNAAGTLIQATKLMNNGSSSGYQEVERNEFTYENGNLIRCKNFINSSLYLEQNVVYDGKNNPMNFGKEWILIGSTRNNRKFEQSSLNNATAINYDQNGIVSTISTTYTYHINDFPSSKTETLTNGSTQVSTYTYLN